MKYEIPSTKQMQGVSDVLRCRPMSQIVVVTSWLLPFITFSVKINFSMARQLVYFLACLSLLICIGLISLWIRSHRKSEGISMINSRGSGFAFSTAPGVLQVQHVTFLSAIDALPWKPGVTWTTQRWGKFAEDDPTLSEQEKFLVEQMRKAYRHRGPNGGKYVESSTLTYSWHPPDHGKFGFGWDGQSVPGTAYHSSRFIVPIWFAIMVFASLPTWMAWSAICKAIREKKRKAAGCCAACGYDLRGSNARCPECGKAF
jgi:hypothetical protein